MRPSPPHPDLSTPASSFQLRDQRTHAARPLCACLQQIATAYQTIQGLDHGLSQVSKKPLSLKKYYAACCDRETTMKKLPMATLMGPTKPLAFVAFARRFWDLMETWQMVQPCRTFWSVIVILTGTSVQTEALWLMRQILTWMASQAT